MGSLSAKNVLFSETITENGTAFVNAQYDGILGLGWQAISSNNIKPALYEFFEQGLIQENSFSFYISKEKEGQSKFFIGGIDEKYAASEFKYYPLLSQDYWVVILNQVAINGLNITNNSTSLKGKLLFLVFL